MHRGHDHRHGRRGAGPGHDLKHGGDISGRARRAKGMVEAGGVGDEAEGPHVAQDGEGGGEETGVSREVE